MWKLRPTIRETFRAAWGALCLAGVVALAACGGGGAEPSAPAADVLPVLTVQPVSQSSAAGTAVTFTVQASGGGLRFMWQRSTDAAVSWTDIAGATTDTYVLAVVDSSMAGHLFRVVVQSGTASAASAAATLTVTPPAPPVLRAQPVDQAATAGGDATLSVTATGFAVTYQWQASTDDGVTWADVGGAMDSSLVLTALDPASTGRRFRAVVRNDGGSVTTQAAVLTVSPALAAPAFTLQPQDVTVVAPGTAAFTVSASGNPVPTWQWQRSTDGGASFAPIDGATAATYTTPPSTLAEHNTRYRAVARNAQGSATSDAAVLSVITPPVVALRQATLTVNSTSCAGRIDGALVCWGSNEAGTLNGDRFDVITNYRSPTEVAGLNGVASISSGSHTCAVRSDARLICWGTNFAGQLGLGAGAISTFFSTPPTAVPGLTAVQQVVTGFGFTCSRQAGGSVACWGNNSVGQLGDGSTTQRPSPTTVPGLVNVVALAAGQAHVCALKSDGTVACWGQNANGAVGDGTTTSRSSPTPVAGLRNVTAISAGGFNGGAHNCALKSDATVVCWGSSSSGQAGSSAADVLTPRAIAGLSDVLAVATSNAHSCALRATGTVACWGINLNGELGTGAALLLGPSSSVSPRAVVGLDTVVAITAGAQATCAARRDGDVFCWGYNGFGQLGDGTLTSRSTPARIPGLVIQLR
jgi:alpha-tubulin suppressor-like RCC1 family protein